MVNQVTAMDIKEDKRTKLLNWGCSGVSRGGWLNLEHFHCTSESNGKHKPNSHCLLSRFSRSYRFKQMLNLSVLSVVSWDKEEEQKENEAGDLIMRTKPVTSLSVEEMLSSSRWPPTLPCVPEFLSAIKFKCRCTTLRSSGRPWPFK